MELPELKIGKLKAKIPIVQGGMAVRISMAPLAAAVANEGGIGLIAASGIHSEELVKTIREARSLSDGIIGINVMVAVREFLDLVIAAAKEGIDLIVAGAGFSRELFAIGKEYDVPIVPIASSVKAAKLAEKFGASAVIVEGKEAGGHLGTDQPLFSILPDIVKAIKIPVIAAGGILHGQDITRAICMGADGVQIGTRFAASKESGAADSLKEVYIKAKADDVVLVESPVGLTGRAIKTQFVKDLFDGKIPSFKNIKKCLVCLKRCNRKYCIIEALERAQRGDMERGLAFSGERVGEISNILPVKTIISNLMKEFKESFKGGQDCSEGL